jgi:hypothetical protein
LPVFPARRLLLGPGRAIAAANADGAALIAAEKPLPGDLAAPAAEAQTSRMARLVSPASLPGSEVVAVGAGAVGLAHQQDAQLGLLLGEGRFAQKYSGVRRHCTCYRPVSARPSIR